MIKINRPSVASKEFQTKSKEATLKICYQYDGNKIDFKFDKSIYDYKIGKNVKIKDILLHPVVSILYPKESYKYFSSTKEPAERPNSEMMRNYKLDLIGMNNMRHWEEAVEEYIKLHFSNKYF